MANVNVRINDNIKINAENIFKSLGITPTIAITLFYNQVIRTNSIPFELKVDTPNEVTMKAINELDDMEKNPNQYKGYHNVDELMEDLIKWYMKLNPQNNLKKILRRA